MTGCTVAGSAWRRRLVDDVHERLFTPRPTGAPGRFGAEAELIAVDAETGEPVPIFGWNANAGDDAPRGRAARAGTLAFLRAYGGRKGWRMADGPHGAPAFDLPGGEQVAYEPGGQIELATPPRPTVAEATADLDGVLPPLAAAAAEAGIHLLGRGIDPFNALDRTRLLLPGQRYRALHRYLSRIGDAGPRMMLQTAAIQVNVELAGPDGSDAALRWRVLQAAAPYLTAIFANSPTYRGVGTGFASFRARQWRLLDRRRTGLVLADVGAPAHRHAAAERCETDPANDPALRRAAEAYTDFGLEAGWIFAPDGREPEPFVEWVLRGEATLDDWREHLTTLFPEVRPRGYLEVRCIDALSAEWCGVPLAVVAGIVADTRSLREAAEIVGEPDSVLLEDAARLGLRAPRIGRRAIELFGLALAAGERTGVVEGRALERARGFFRAFTARGRAPGDESVGAAA